MSRRLVIFAPNPFRPPSLFAPESLYVLLLAWWENGETYE